MQDTNGAQVVYFLPDFMEKYKRFHTMWIDFYMKVSRSTNLTPK